MTKLASVLFGAGALAAATIGFAQPAAARGDVGVYISPYGFGVSVDRYQNYCRDEWYRRNHWNYCSRYYGGDYDDNYGYYNNGYYNNGYYSNNGYRYRNNDRGDRNRHHEDRGGERHGHDGGERHDHGDRGDDRGHGDHRGW